MKAPKLFTVTTCKGYKKKKKKKSGNLQKNASVKFHFTKFHFTKITIQEFKKKT
jgi:hypothetical protein